MSTNAQVRISVFVDIPRGRSRSILVCTIVILDAPRHGVHVPMYVACIVVPLVVLPVLVPRDEVPVYRSKTPPQKSCHVAPWRASRFAEASPIPIVQFFAPHDVPIVLPRQVCAIHLVS